MGMDLIPKNKEVTPIHYNWTWWGILLRFLEENKCPMSEFSGMNDGNLISETTCKRVAEIIRNRFFELPRVYFEYIKERQAAGHKFGKTRIADAEIKESFLAEVPFWEDCGGCEQW
jgi:hypothetical protein